MHLFLDIFLLAITDKNPRRAQKPTMQSISTRRFPHHSAIRQGRVLLSYCLVGPIASKLNQIVEADSKPYTIAKATIIAYAEGTPVQIAIELARRMTPSHYAPSFSELEESLQPLRAAA